MHVRLESHRLSICKVLFLNETLMNTALKIALLFLTAMLTFGPTAAAQESKVTIKVLAGKRTFVGKLLAADDETMVLLRRNGRMTMIPRERIEAAKTVASNFTAMTKDEMRAQLQREFGNKYQVSVTDHFLVVHPEGDYQIWAMPFEKLYIRFNNYFHSRSVNLDEPEFPMVAVVLQSRAEFDRFLENYHEADNNILGYYSPKSNRIITYDQTEGAAKDHDWFFTVDTIIHEATHQSAFNTGLHSRFASNPIWIAEGLATMFEAQGVQNSQYYSKPRDRINFGRLADLKALYQNDKVDDKLIARMISSDDIFNESPAAAYTLAWGLTYYLAEKQPEKYAAFLRKDSDREDFRDYSSRERLEDFIRKFGSISNLSARMKTFIKSLPDE